MLMMLMMIVLAVNGGLYLGTILYTACKSGPTGDLSLLEGLTRWILA